MIKVTVFAGPSIDGQDDRPATIRDWSEYGPSEALRRIGLEYGSADYFQSREVVITLSPVAGEDFAAVRRSVRQAAEALEGTGLL